MNILTFILWAVYALICTAIGALLGSPLLGFLAAVGTLPTIAVGAFIMFIYQEVQRSRRLAKRRRARRV